ncbi:MAG: dihydroneopterin aldolase [Prevotella sp.]|nr:dihydroneopterin aldolase [Prevotella sp.]
MTIESSHITLNDLRFYAYHGVLPQERVVGGDYSISLRVAADLSKAIEQDDVNVTLNYATLYEVIQREMNIPSNLLEHLAGRIGRTILDVFPQIEVIDLSVTKLNPPMGANCQGAGVELRMSR